MQIFKRATILLMLIAFFALSFTGLVRVPEIQRYFGFVYNFISASQLALVHDWSGVMLVVLIVIHLILKRKWFFELFKDIPTADKLSRKNISAVAVVVALVLGAFYFGSQRKSQPVMDLPGVEVTQYQGEKLGSIDDFRENSIKGVQRIDKEQYSLEINGLVEQPVRYSYADLLELQSYQKVVQLDCVEGWSVKALWKGFLVKDLVKNLTINPEAKTIIFYAADGYSTSFPLEYILNNDILMAYELNGVELPPERGFPFQLVAQEKWGYKWIKWITRIELSSDTNYKGYWESRGYNNNGDRNGPKFESK